MPTATQSPQSELPLFQCDKSDKNVADFVLLLRANGNWMTAKSVLIALGISETESGRRMVRAWAEAAEDEVISGQKGYRYTDSASADEIHHFCSWMESQSTKMKLRAARTRARAHRTVG